MARQPRQQVPRPTQAPRAPRQQPYQHPTQNGGQDGIRIRGTAPTRAAKNETQTTMERKPKDQRRYGDSPMLGSPYNVRRDYISEDIDRIKEEAQSANLPRASMLSASAPAFEPHSAKNATATSDPSKVVKTNITNSSTSKEETVSTKSLLQLFIKNNTKDGLLKLTQSDETLIKAGCNNTDRSTTLEAILTVFGDLPSKDKKTLAVNGVVLFSGDLYFPTFINKLRQALPNLSGIYLGDFGQPFLPGGYSCWNIAHRFRNLSTVNGVDVTNLRTTKEVKMSASSYN